MYRIRLVEKKEYTLIIYLKLNILRTYKSNVKGIQENLLTEDKVCNNWTFREF